MILANHFTDNPETFSQKTFKKFLLLLAPFAPHITEELWQQIGDEKKKICKFSVKNSIHSQQWPECNAKYLVEKKVFLLIQINGKIRDTIEVDYDIKEEKARELAISSEKIKKWLGEETIKKIIFVPGKLINIVI
jgi:leucyl-tRNA synthetase